MVAADLTHTVLLRSDGVAVACGVSRAGCCDFPASQAGVTYVGVAAGSDRTVLLRSDGQLLAAIMIAGSVIYQLLEKAWPVCRSLQVSIILPCW